MGADRLAVDLDGLEDFAANLESIRQRMNATRDMVNAYHGEMGSAEVENALDDFEGNWSDGRKKIDENAGRLAAMAREAAAGLRQTDNDLATELARAQQGDEGDGSGGRP